MKTQQRTVLCSTREVIDALGGTTKAAQFMRVRPSRVSNMIAENWISAGHHRPIEIYLRHLGYEIDAKSVFGYTTEDIINRVSTSEGCSAPSDVSHV